MKNNPKSFSFWGVIMTCLFFLPAFPVLSQESILVANCNATGNGGSVSYSVGQVAFNTFQSAGGTVTQGIQQPFEILFMDGIADESTLALDCIVYPNPATSEIRLKVGRVSFDGLSCQLRNPDGLLLKEVNIDSRETIIPTVELPAGIYFVTVIGNHKNLTTWKVIKN